MILKVHFPLQVKEGSHPYEVPTEKSGLCLIQRPLKEELEWLQRQQIIALLGVDETSEWCHSFGILVPKANGEGEVVPRPGMQLNETLIRPNHRDPMLNGILSRLAGVNYLILIDASST